ncbi:MAG TPA: FAD-dependent oxidoreductase [Anaerovoracaceae bacterium]|nr:FAD-dependent oxidoreductase [Anaerovoracaceae bacterium]
MKYDYHIIVIGGGSGGLLIAAASSSLGAKVALIESNKMGGECLNYGCVPSKSLLRSAHINSYVNNANRYGLNAGNNTADINSVLNRVNKVVDGISPHDSKERFEEMGVDVYLSKGEFIDANRIAIGDKSITGKNIVIATGSSPTIPPIEGLDKVNYYTNETIFNIEYLPKHLIVLGAGPIGTELSQAFNNLGSKVTMVNRSDALFRKDEPEVKPIMKDIFISEGVEFQMNIKIKSVKEDDEGITLLIEKDGKDIKVKGDALLVALGRKPNTKELGLKKAGVELSDKGHVLTDSYLRTNIKNIYAVGDVTGLYAFTHMAGYQGSIVVQNIIFPVKKKVDYSNVPWVTYTKPEVAHVGHTEKHLTDNKMEYKVYMESLSENDRALAEENTEGFLKIITDKRGIVIGATMISEKAGEQIGLANMAINKKIKITEFMQITFPYPTELEIYKTLAVNARKESIKSWQMKLIKKMFLR